MIEKIRINEFDTTVLFPPSTEETNSNRQQINILVEQDCR